jgi:hypothetical protein
MVVDFTARVKHGRLRIEVPQARLDIDISDMVACDRSTKVSRFSINGKLALGK